jgi:hypothetical protein
LYFDENLSHYYPFYGSILQYYSPFNLQLISNHLNNNNNNTLINYSEDSKNISNCFIWKTSIDSLSISESYVLLLKDELEANLKSRI